MANYNFNMKEFNGTSYDTLYPKTTSQQVLLNDSALATKLGLSGTPSINDLFNGKNLYGEVLSYQGNGQNGASYPCSLTFTSAPKAVFFLGTGTGGTTPYAYDVATKNMLTPNSLTTSYEVHRGFYLINETYTGVSYAKISADGKTISWYCAYNQGYEAESQLNALGVTYYFLGVW